MMVNERASYVIAGLNYLVPPTIRPRIYADEPPAGEKKNTAAFKSHSVMIADARPTAAGLSLDREAFKLARHCSRVRDFYDDDEVRRVYYAEAAVLIARESGANRVVLFDHTIRRRTPSDYAVSARSPVTSVHIDYTRESAPQRVRDLLGMEAEALLRRRFAIINAWRPLRAPLRDAPLAMVDASTLSMDHLVAVDLIYPDRTGAVYYVTYDPAHRWFYVPSMDIDEVLIFKNYDSDPRPAGRFAAHAAFDDPTPWSTVVPRESIEVRALAFFQ